MNHEWSVNLDGEANDGGRVLTIVGGSVYLDCWVPSVKRVLEAAKYLRNNGSKEPFLLGTFVNGSRVEITAHGERKALYLAVVESEFCCMSYQLQSTDTQMLAFALEEACK